MKTILLICLNVEMGYRLFGINLIDLILLLLGTPDSPHQTRDCALFGKLQLMRCQVCHLAGQETYPKPLTSKRQVVLSKKDQGMDDSFRNLEPSPSTFLYHMRAKFPIRIPSKAFIRISISVP